MSDEIIPFFSGELPMKTIPYISGSGTNFREALKVYDKFSILHENGIIKKKPFEFPVVVCNHSDVKGLNYARKRETKIPEIVYTLEEHSKESGLSKTGKDFRKSYDSAILEKLALYKVDHFALLGWDRRFSEHFVKENEEKGVVGTNVHPSRDPINIGGTMGAVQQAFDLRESRIRSTYQLVDVVVDHGKFLVQSDWVNTNEVLPEGWRKNEMDNEEILDAFMELKKQEGNAFKSREDAKEEYCGNLQDILKERGGLDNRAVRSLQYCNWKFRARQGRKHLFKNKLE